MIHKSKGERIFDVFNTVFMLLLCAVFIYPLVYEFNLSISGSVAEGSLSMRLLPTFPLDFSAYKKIFGTKAFLTSLANTLFRTVVGTVLTVTVTFCGGYVLAKREMPGNKILTIFILITMFFSGGLIPTYLNLKNLGLQGSRWALILPTLTSAWYLLIVRNFIRAIPVSMEEAAIMDGAGIFTIMFRVFMPLSKPIIAVISLWSAVTHWNAWYDAMLYAPSKNKTVLALYLRRILVENSQDELANLTTTTVITPETVKAAIIVISVIPIACAYPLFQQYFIKGVQVGGVKE